MSELDPNSLEDHGPIRSFWIVQGVGYMAVLVIAVVLVSPMIGDLITKRASCANKLKQIGLALKIYSNEDSSKLFPTLSREPGRLMFDPLLVYQEYMPDSTVNLCPNDADLSEITNVAPTELIDDWSYFYLGYTVRSDEDMERFAATYREHVGAGRAMEENIIAPEDRRGVRTIFRLRNEVWRHFVVERGTDIISVTHIPGGMTRLESAIPLLIERIGNHWRDGANVLYLDGHVDFIEYPGKWPMTEKTVRILNELDALGARTPTP